MLPSEFTNITSVRELGDGRMLLADGREKRLNERFGAVLNGSDRAGRVLGVEGYVWASAARVRADEYADSLRVVLFQPGAEGRYSETPLTTMVGPGMEGYCVTARGAGVAAAASTCNPLRTQEQALLFPDGWIAVARVAPYRVDWRSPDGRWRRGSPLPFDRVPVNDLQKCSAVQGFPYGALSPCDPDAAKRFSWPSQLPPFISYLSSGTAEAAAPATPTLFAAPDGSLVIRLTPDRSRPETRYHAIDRSGNLVRAVTMERHEAIVGFGAGVVYTIATDPLGLQSIRKHPWP